MRIRDAVKDQSMKEVVVYLTEDYSKNETIWVNGDLTKEQITEVVNEQFAEWYYYDIVPRKPMLLG